MFKTIQNVAAGLFIFFVAVLTLIAVLAVWDVFSKDVMSKSLTTIGILAFASLVVIVAARAVEKHQDTNSPSVNQ